MSDNAASSMRRDLASAYAVTGARVTSWVVVSAVVYRRLGADALGLLTLVRATVGILAYTSLGLGPALVKVLSEVAAPRERAHEVPIAALAVAENAHAQPLLMYAESAAMPLPSEMVARVYVTGERLAVGLGLVGLMLAGIYGSWFRRLHEVSIPGENTVGLLVMLIGAGTVFRLLSEAPSGLLQARGRIALDNGLLAATELGWGIWTVVAIGYGSTDLTDVGVFFLAANFGLLLLRARLGRIEVRTLTSARAKFDGAVAARLLMFGTLIVLAQVADFLYAPTDCILINRFLGPDFVGYYSPAIQIDAGLLLLVSGLASVLYPKSAAAHAAGDLKTLRDYYLRGTIFSTAILLAASGFVWACSKWIFLIWFQDPMPQTQAILPLLLIHTVVGGSSAVGRSILLAMGKAKPFTLAVLIAGVSNVVLSLVLVKYAHLGLKGIVLGTIVAVVGRCAIWMPWYVMRTLRSAGGDGGARQR